jgi:murein DD-endopeptidase MepM/ murein hydrolase activator NlpD
LGFQPGFGWGLASLPNVEKEKNLEGHIGGKEGKRAMEKPYFIFVIAHSLHGRLRRVHLPHSVIYGVLLFALVGFVSVLGMVSSYARMALKVSDYNTLRDQMASLQSRYQTLQKEADESTKQMATLQLFAAEVSSAYGIQRGKTVDAGFVPEGRLVPSLRDSVDQFTLLKSVTLTPFSRRRSSFLSRTATPSLWPVAGTLSSGFGIRLDPFRGRGAGFHPGVDIICPVGTPIRATADGRVIASGWNPGYGLTVEIDHENGHETLYAHLSRVAYVVGQEVRRGEVIGYSGMTGHTTGPHLHYEVHVNGAVVNPYRYMQSVYVAKENVKRDLPF